MSLKVIHERGRTGFEEHKDFPIRLHSLIAARYQVSPTTLALWTKLWPWPEPELATLALAIDSPDPGPSHRWP